MTDAPVAPLGNPFLEPPPRVPRPIKPAGRLNAKTYELNCEGHQLTLTAARDAETGQLLEVVIHGPKIGQTLDLVMQDLGAAVSRLCQNRDPITGLPFRLD
jgi:hypothetical protein